MHTIFLSYYYLTVCFFVKFLPPYSSFKVENIDLFLFNQKHLEYFFLKVTVIFKINFIYFNISKDKYMFLFAIEDRSLYFRP